MALIVVAVLFAVCLGVGIQVVYFPTKAQRAADEHPSPPWWG